MFDDRMCERVRQCQANVTNRLPDGSIVRVETTHRIYDVWQPHSPSTKSTTSVSTAFCVVKKRETPTNKYLKRLVEAINGGNSSSACALFLTAYHCVEGALDIELTLPTEAHKARATLVAAVPHMDMALISTESDLPFKSVEIGDSDSVAKESDVSAEGFALGELHLQSVSGKISSRTECHMQVDISINSGNSGGPLVYQGKIIGIVVSKAVGSGAVPISGVNFAVPIRETLEILYKNSSYIGAGDGFVRGVHIGVVTSCVPHAYIENILQASKSFKSGVLVRHVLKRQNWKAIALTDALTHTPQVAEVPETANGLYAFSMCVPDTVQNDDILCAIQLQGMDMVTLDADAHVKVDFWAEPLHYTALIASSARGETATLFLHNASRGDYSVVCKLGFNISPYRLHYPEFECIDYICFGGLVIMPLNKNLLANVDLRRLFFKYTDNVESKFTPPLVISFVMNNCAFKPRPVQFGVVFKVARKSVNTLDDVRRITTQNCATDDSSVVVNVGATDSHCAWWGDIKAADAVNTEIIAQMRKM